ncbi:MAG: hypothetical protein A3G33_10030 [Omnitrophica bacterium RIFCSPLOWO2_12_FULL_44_17]|uniref:Uncharacterized protein n=1 Tax=Candidatus Danuiimicrobium aquiferis TaxID=1801832 RepID=A0A1G1L1X8_9BACT|nr:MAG: hypothetical protein A3B72_08580 [Omnitrophica bacterium RIFCSPHIGHO2_02_FULL_45_28]OGW88783.1 MAG: hypothetical protein A3E74_05400 [Omnitrophica bacterium RIFCSPHIGHO2_12_FULL_44_12]OGW99160.1 MAG: hypothetical protein A3G33_10030 [Omnitrophica bacterium RIFCSPLOWO2_12_FULL_44_17]OGX04423.1 MAG: hypothetical protein A3J12_00580 [Omnitrophica bacterium RIFCSPLOWO2_02_FULL_44_11]
MPKRKPMKKKDQSLSDIQSEFSQIRHDIKQKLNYINTHLDKLWENAAIANERLQDLEVYINLLGRLITTLSVEKMGINLKHLKTLLQRIEKEVIADSQIQDLEEMFHIGERKLTSEKPEDPAVESEESAESADSEDVVYFGDEEKELGDESDIDEDEKSPGGEGGPSEE